MGFEMMLAFHGGPALAGIKPSNLISCGYKEVPDLENQMCAMNNCMNNKGIVLRPLKRLQSRLLILVYRQDKLWEIIHSHENAVYLSGLGYPVEEGLEQVLLCLEKRLQKDSDFPHEIGIFLGYPLEDVVGFVENQGKNCRLAGCWKVYGEPSTAQALFDRYERCRNCICRRVEQGFSLPQLFGCVA